MSGEALTIGEVIGRLAADFPDLTVSKIRYLESGGLISPERTPAGYRRFSEQDVDKLRWVLAAQRDQYLPLKVIRQHLAADGPRGAAGDPERVVAALTSGADSGPDPYAAVDDGEPRGADAGPGQRTTAAAVTAAGSTAADPAGAPALPPVASLKPPLAPLPQPRTRTATVADPEFYETSRTDVGELHLGRDGLARTSGVSGSFVADLVSFGLLPAAESYGGDAVFIVRAAWALTEFGLEARHLRPLLTGARTTAGLLDRRLPARRHDGVAGAGRQAAASRAAARSTEACAAAVKLYGALLRAELAPRGPSATVPTLAPGASRESSSGPGMPRGPVPR